MDLKKQIKMNEISHVVILMPVPVAALSEAKALIAWTLSS
jgi:hypothetical protein